MNENPINACRRIPPEDLRPGMFIVILGVVHEFLVPGSFDDPAISRPRTVRFTCIGCADGEPLRILSICIPFVQLEDACGNLRTLDIRCEQIGAVAEDYALEAFTRPASGICRGCGC